MKKIIFFGFIYIIIAIIIIVLYYKNIMPVEFTYIFLTAVGILITIMGWHFQDPTEKIISTINKLIVPFESQLNQPKTIENENIQVDDKKEQVALAVSAIIFHKTSNPLRILFWFSKKQNCYILPGGHFYKKFGDTNEKIPAWYVDPNISPVDFLLEEKLKDKYGIDAYLDSDFHLEREDIRGMATIEPAPFLTLFERPLHGEGHIWHYDFYYICKMESPNDSKMDTDPSFKWFSSEDVERMVKDRKTFPNLSEVAVQAEAAKKEIMTKKE